MTLKKTDDDTVELQNIIASVDNAIRRNHLRLKGLEEEAAGDNIKYNCS